MEKDFLQTKNYSECLINNSVDMIVSVDIDRNIVVFNPAAEKAFGYTKEEVIGKHISMLYADPSQGLHVSKSVKNLGEFEGEILNRRKNGSTFISKLATAILHNEDGNIIGVMGISRDVTKLKQTEEQLQKLYHAIEQSPSTVMITDTKGDIEYVNPKFSQLTGYTAKEANGQNPRFLKSGKTSKDVYKDLWKTITSGNEWKGELCNRNKNGDLYWESTSISPVRNDKNTIHTLRCR